MDNIPANILCCMHRPKTLHNPHETRPDAQLPHAKPEPNQGRALECPAPAQAGRVASVVVRFTGYRVRPLDPDNFAGSVKDCLDGLRHAHLIDGDEPWRITLETRQIRVASYSQEQTVIEIDL
jgi:hypothetical protein